VLSVRRHAGFTIIELLIGIAILAIVLGLGAPAMGTYLQNSKLAAATASFYAGVQAARTEAIRRNMQSQFVLTDLPLSTGGLANAPGLATPNGRSWVVRSLLPPPAAPGTFEAVDMKSSNEGEASVAAQSIVVNCVLPAGCSGAIPFNGFGGTADGQTYRVNISNPAAGACAPGGIRCRSITVSPGGQIAACDSTIPLPSGDTRACPF
jgi:type IV fimbrial biogenesis protein FimT